MIQNVTRSRLRLVDGEWPFEVENRAAIAAHWQDEVRQNPSLWNGRVLRARRYDLADGVLSGELVETDYASGLAWRAWGYPDKSVFNCFGAALIVSSDGSLLFGQMGAHTANAGRIYPPGGSLDPEDVGPDGFADIDRSIARELFEETGLLADEAEPGPLLALARGQMVALNRVLRFDVPAADLAARIRANLVTQEERELEDIVVIGSVAELGEVGAVPYAKAMGAHLLS